MLNEEDEQEKNENVTEESLSPEEDSLAETVEISKQELEDLYKRLQDLEAMKENLQRHAADFENAKKRLAKEREDFVKFSQEKLIKSLLPILDNFGRALSHSELPEEALKDINKATQHFNNVLSGIGMVQKQLDDVMKNQGLVEIEALKKPFDPHKHEALAYVEEDGIPDEVTDVIESGYMLNDRLLRAAKVRVRATPKDKTEE